LFLQRRLLKSEEVGIGPQLKTLRRLSQTRFKILVKVKDQKQSTSKEKLSFSLFYEQGPGPNLLLEKE